ncbi:MAG TPA: penicillin acylase family protein, partial [Ktedonobacterales bacterium]
MKRPLFASPLSRFVLALVAAAAVLYACAVGAGPLPPLGAALNPGTGVWTSATAARPLVSQTLRFAGLQQPVTVVFEPDGTAHIRAATDHDLFWTIGYLHARFRLTQMDLERRQGEGLLSEVLGAQALNSDGFMNIIGLQRTAAAEWQALPASSIARQAVLAYAAGVNARIGEDERSASLPFMFKLLNYQPRPWTPIDSLVVQGDLIFTQDFSPTPLAYAELVKSLGYQRTMQWFPVLPLNGQHPYDPGPYQAPGALAPLPAQLTDGPATLRAIAALETRVRQLPTGLVRR